MSKALEPHSPLSPMKKISKRPMGPPAQPGMLQFSQRGLTYPNILPVVLPLAFLIGQHSPSNSFLQEKKRVSTISPTHSLDLRHPSNPHSAQAPRNPEKIYLGTTKTFLHQLKRQPKTPTGTKARAKPKLKICGQKKASLFGDSRLSSKSLGSHLDSQLKNPSLSSLIYLVRTRRHRRL